ncbi:MAG TPA: family 43 glycosylhydrolase, partial [bacterium]
ILTQRYLNPKRESPITCTGHADFVQTEAGEWWAVFLGCRPYPPVEENYYNTGRETFLAPVKWKDGWPIINPDHEEVQYHYSVPIKPSQEPSAIPYSGNFKYRDDFDAGELNLNWIFLRTPHEKWYDLNRREGFLSVQLRSETCAGKMNPCFLGHRQQHAQCSASISLNFVPESEHEKAGLLIFQNEKHFYLLCKSLEENEPVVQLYNSIENENTDNQMELLAFQKIKADQSDKDLYLKIAAHGNVYSFLYSFDAQTWSLLKDNVDASFLSTKVAGGFVGCVYALYATSLGLPSKNFAHLDWFEYQGDDKVYQ